MQYNRKNPEFKIPLVGLGIGDGFTNPYVQESTYGEYAYHMGLIDISTKEVVETLIVNCQNAINESLPVPSREADQICNLIGILTSFYSFFRGIYLQRYWRCQRR
jgi:hypothetical protein